MRTSYLLKVLFSSMVALSVAVALLACPLPASAASITIDDFDNPSPGTAYFISYFDPNPFLHKDSTIPGVIGGERDYYVEVKGTASPISAAGIISDAAGRLQVASFGKPGSFEILQYDGADVDGGDALIDAEGLGGIDLTDSGTNWKLRLRFDSVDGGDSNKLRMKISVVDNGVPASKEYDIDESISEFVFDAPFSAFGVPFTSVDSITFAFNDLATPMPNVDFELRSIRAVPEPSILAMLGGLGAFGLLAWRWRRRRA